MAKGKKEFKELIKSKKTWLWVVIGSVAGWFAFGPVGLVLGLIGGYYIGSKI